MITGSQLLFFDPSGTVFGPSERPADPNAVKPAALTQRGPQAGGSSHHHGQQQLHETPSVPVGKAFTFFGNDLAKRFADQFSAFPSLDPARPLDGVLLRLPLRAAPLAGAVGGAAAAQGHGSGLFGATWDVPRTHALLNLASVHMDRRGAVVINAAATNLCSHVPITAAMLECSRAVKRCRRNALLLFHC